MSLPEDSSGIAMVRFVLSVDMHFKSFAFTPGVANFDAE